MALPFLPSRLSHPLLTHAVITGPQLFRLVPMSAPKKVRIVSDISMELILPEAVLRAISSNNFLVFSKSRLMPWRMLFFGGTGGTGSGGVTAVGRAVPTDTNGSGGEVV